MNNQEAIDLLDNLIGMISDNQDSDYDEALKLGIKALSENKGEWISNEKKGTSFPMWCRYKCSCCGMDADKSDFCPNCGADMRGE